MQYRFACCASMDKYTIRILSFYNWCFACVAFKMMLLFRTETQQNRASSLAWLAVKWPKIGGRVNVQSLLPSNLCPLRVYASKSVSGISATSGRMTPFHTYSEVFFFLQKHLWTIWRKFIYNLSLNMFEITTCTKNIFRMKIVRF